MIRVESTLSGTSCRKCGKELTHFHGFDQPIRLRHLPIFEQPVYVELKPKRYQCGHCKGKPTTTQRLSWHELRSPNTKPYEKWLLRFLINSTVVDVANKLSRERRNSHGSPQPLAKNQSQLGAIPKD